MVTSVAAEAGSIGYVSMSYVDESVRALSLDAIAPTLANVSSNLYPLRATLFVVGLGEPEGEYRYFIAWIQSQEGQAVVGQRYAPLSRP
jgi:phosphate transport system substrate-binding protein